MKVFKEGTDVTGWTMTEKFDGVNATWDGTNFISRNGNIIHCPESHKPSDPAGTEGELWSGCGKFQQVVSTVKKIVPLELEWGCITFIRFNKLDEWFCRNNEDMESFYHKVLAHGGEGIVLKAPDGTLYKRKPDWTDECTVLGYVEGKGKFNDGIAGALEVEWNSKRFKLTLPIAELRKNPPPIGSSVTFKYRGLTDGGKPRFPTYIINRDYE
jgi:DNA ligase-1